MSIIQTDINPSLLNTLYDMLNSITIPKRASTSQRYNTTGMRYICFGLVKYKIQYKNKPTHGESRFTQLYPEIYNYENKVIEDKYFSNCGHMNDMGAKKFTAKIIKDFFNK